MSSNNIAWDSLKVRTLKLMCDPRFNIPLVALANVADAWKSGVGQYIPLVEVLLGTVQKWIDVSGSTFTYFCVTEQRK